MKLLHTPNLAATLIFILAVSAAAPAVAFSQGFEPNAIVVVTPNPTPPVDIALFLRGFSAYAVVDVYVTDGSSLKVKIARLYLDGSGGGIKLVGLPRDLPPGSYTLEFVEGNSVKASVPIEVTDPQIRLSSYTVKPGDVISATVSGLGAGPLGLVYFLAVDGVVVGYLMADDRGVASIEFMVPPLPSGRHKVQVVYPGLVWVRLESLYGGPAVVAETEITVVDGVVTEATLSQALASIESRLSELEDRVNSVESIISSFEAKIAELEAAVESVKTSISSLSGALNSLEGRVDDIEGRLDTVEQGLVSLSSRISDLEDLVAGLEGDISALENEVNSLKSAIDSIERIAMELEDGLKDLENVKDQLEMLDNRVGSVEAKISALEEGIQSTRESIDVIQSSIEELSQRLEALEDDAAQASREIASIKSMLESEASRLSDLSKQLDAIEISVNDLQKTMEDLSRRLSQLESRLEKAGLQTGAPGYEKETTTIGSSPVQGPNEGGDNTTKGGEANEADNAPTTIEPEGSPKATPKEGLNPTVIAIGGLALAIIALLAITLLLRRQNLSS
ncbi:MAG: hypothetical protein F7B17_02470 [Desulfurococcales archaeon]|nr:hypothetical protein [Desulfurococcales archaeon]